MNREILFRGKRADNGEWVTSSSLIQCYDNDNNGARMFYIAQKNEEYIAICSCGTNNISAITCKDKARFYKVIPETVGQYTGLTDKNGNRIFEGDVVRIIDKITGVITFECGAYGVGSLHAIDYDYLASQIKEVTGCDNSPYFCYNDNFISLWELYWNFNQEDDCLDIIEIIGNIHDNSELLEKN